MRGTTFDVYVATDRSAFRQFAAIQLSTILLASLPSSVFNQNPPHRLGGSREEMATVVKTDIRVGPY